MYVCQCNAVPERDILAAIDRLIEQGSRRSITAADVLLELNRYGKCLGCFPLIDDLINKALGSSHGRQPVSQRVSAPAVARTNLDRQQPATTAAKPRRRGGSLARRSRT